MPCFFAPFFLIVGAIAAIVALIPYWFIFKKAGFSPWIAVLMIVPLVNLIVLYVVAFSQWKVMPLPYAYPAMPPPN